MQENETVPYLISAPSDIAWAAASAAQRINEGYRPVTEHNNNKELMLHLMRYEPNLITDEDVQLGQEARSWFQGNLFNLLGGGLNEYMQRATEVSIKDEINIRLDVGILSSLPNTWRRSSRKQVTRDIITESTGGHVGTITEKIQRNVQVLTVAQGVSFTGWLVTATDGTHIYRFCSSAQFTDDEMVMIQGKVKKHDFDKDTNRPVTWLNYVKKLS